MKFDLTLLRSCRRYGFYYLSPAKGWCCPWLSDFKATAMITEGVHTVYYLELDDDRPWLKWKEFKFCPFCADRFELSSNRVEIER
ncbi:MAG: hypothetical protein KIY10_10545 [Thermoplasmata archaeon]|nr:hypothetical protein [Candidatus Sysuiplasma jiujiangense]